MQTHKKIGFIGAGNMAYSLVSGLLRNQYPGEQIWVSDPDTNKLSHWSQQFSVHTAASNIEVAQTVDIIILAVKPQIMQVVCKEIATQIRRDNPPLLISIAAGITCDAIQTWLRIDHAQQLKLVRCMPNTPALVQSGITGLYALPQVNESDKVLAENILRAVGTTIWLDDEDQLHALTAVSGSGPAYYFYFIELMGTIAEHMGLAPEVARLLAVETAFGAAKMVLESTDTPAQLRQKVTSPGGTTEQALKVMQRQHLDQILYEALQAAKERSQELAKT